MANEYKCRGCGRKYETNNPLGGGCIQCRIEVRCTKCDGRGTIKIARPVS